MANVNFVQRLGNAVIGGAMMYALPLMIFAIIDPGVIRDYWGLYLIACVIPLLVGVPLLSWGKRLGKGQDEID